MLYHLAMSGISSISLPRSIVYQAHCHFKFYQFIKVSSSLRKKEIAKL